MKVIFTDSMTGVASRGDIKNVKPGFFRNYLLPYKKAIPATDTAMREWEERRKQMMIAKQELLTQIEETKRRFEGLVLKIAKKVTKKNTLYGGVKGTDIAAALKEQVKIEIPAAAVIIEKEIKAVGSYKVKIDLGEGITTEVGVEIIGKE